MSSNPTDRDKNCARQCIVHSDTNGPIDQLIDFMPAARIISDHVSSELSLANNKILDLEADVIAVQKINDNYLRWIKAFEENNKKQADIIAERDSEIAKLQLEVVRHRNLEELGSCLGRMPIIKRKTDESY